MSNRGATTTQRVTAALRLRRWAAAALTGKLLRLEEQDIVAGWDLFAEAERCALPLSRRLRKSGSARSLPDALWPRLESRVAEEQARVNAARRHLETVARVARAEDLRIVLLKGTAAALDYATAVDLVDVDVLGDPRTAARLAELLDDHGYRGVGHSSACHLAARSNDDILPVEIHTTLDRFGAPLADEVWNALQPVSGCPQFFRLPPAVHLEHVLEHSVVDHPNRRGHLRELLVIGDAVERVGSDTPSTSGAPISHVDNRTRHAVIEAAKAVRGTEVPSDGDAMVWPSSLAYAAREVLRDARLPRLVAGYVYDWMFALLIEPASRRLLLRDIFRTSHDRSAYPRMARIEAGGRFVGRGARVAMRSGRAALAVALAGPHSLAVRRLARDARRAFETDVAGTDG